MPKPRKKMREEPELKLCEDPFLLDDPGGSPMEWIDVSCTVLHEAIRREPAGDPWEGSPSRMHADTECLTERRRRKLQHLSMNVEDPCADGRGESVA